MHIPPLRALAGLSKLATALLLSQTAGTLAVAATSTQSAYRCVTAQGAVSYSQQPCPISTEERLVNAQDDRTEAQRQQAQANVQRDKAMAHDHARQARLHTDRATQHMPSDLSGKVRQVAVGQREVDRRGLSTESLKHNPRQFRAKAPRKAAGSAASTP